MYGAACLSYSLPHLSFSVPSLLPDPINLQITEHLFHVICFLLFVFCSLLFACCSIFSSLHILFHHNLSASLRGLLLSSVILHSIILTPAASFLTNHALVSNFQGATESSAVRLCELTNLLEDSWLNAVTQGDFGPKLNHLLATVRFGLLQKVIKYHYFE